MSFNPGGGGGIQNASDVALNNPANDQPLVFKTGTGKWTNSSMSVGDAKAVNLYDADTSSYPTRPAGYSSVEWIGPADPGTAAQDNDTWIDTDAA